MSDVTVAETAEAKASRRRGIYDLDLMLLTVTETDKPDVVYALRDIPGDAQAYCVMHGMWMFLRAAETPDAGFVQLVAGDVVAPKATTRVAHDLAPWKQAVAATLVSLSAKAGNPMTQEQANERAGALDRGQIAAARKDPAVVKHYAKLFPTVVESGSSLTTLLA